MARDQHNLGDMVGAGSNTAGICTARGLGCYDNETYGNVLAYGHMPRRI
jgi:hypothetical protein